jgi:hypothetical protein
MRRRSSISSLSQPRRRKYRLIDRAYPIVGRPVQVLFTVRCNKSALGHLQRFEHTRATLYENRGFVAGGGLVSYGGLIADAYRLTGVYAGRVLKGEKPGELPVQQGTAGCSRHLRCSSSRSRRMVGSVINAGLSKA